MGSPVSSGSGGLSSSSESLAGARGFGGLAGPVWDRFACSVNMRAISSMAAGAVRRRRAPRSVEQGTERLRGVSHWLYAGRFLYAMLCGQRRPATVNSQTMS